MQIYWDNQKRQMRQVGRIFCKTINRQCQYKRNTAAHWRNYCCREKAKNITYSKCVCLAFVIRQAKRKPRIVLSFVVRLALPYFPTLSYRSHDFRKKNIKHKTKS
jgi:hypothetical protein